jgi:hypothetical protein
VVRLLNNSASIPERGKRLFFLFPKYPDQLLGPQCPMMWVFVYFPGCKAAGA